MPGLATATLLVRDYGEAAAWFQRCLMLSIADDVDQGGGKRWLTLETGGARLLLAKADGARQEAEIGRQAGGRAAFFLEITDFQSHYEHMLSAGVRFLESPRDEPYGIVVQFEDLYGNKWDLLQPIQAKDQTI